MSAKAKDLPEAEVTEVILGDPIPPRKRIRRKRAEVEEVEIQ